MVSSLGALTLGNLFMGFFTPTVLLGKPHLVILLWYLVVFYVGFRINIQSDTDFLLCYFNQD